MNEITDDYTADSSGAIRPDSLDDFTGQSDQLQHLKTYIEGAKSRGEPLDHTLFYGPPGLGKTTLSKIIAGELGSDFHQVSAPSISKPAELAAMITGLQECDVLFIDEIHRLPTIVEEMLYTVMEDFELTIVVGENFGDQKPIVVKISPFTLIAATTRKGALTQPLQDRFGMEFRLDFYPPEDLAVIIKRAAEKYDQDIPMAQCMDIAKRARGTPRVALKILRRLRDFHQVSGEPYTKEFVSTCLDNLGISPEGFNELDRRYLHELENTFNGGPVGIDTLATALSESRDTLETSVEPYLVRQRAIKKTNRGRVLNDPDLFGD